MIALRILAALRSQQPDVELAVLPIVGEGQSFSPHNIAVVGTPKTLPSGGFLYMDGRQFLRDLGGGLVPLTWAQLQALKTWSRQGGRVLAVGDLVPMTFAWWSGLPYAIVGTAKSAYYLRTEAGLLPDLPWYAGWANSIYLPWERWFMTRDRCRATFVRDALTAKELEQLKIGPVYTANPMMDGLDGTGQTPLNSPTAHALVVVLLPGSRPPEAYANWRHILQAVKSVQQQFYPTPVHCLGAIAPALSLDSLGQHLQATGWQPLPGAPVDYAYSQGNSTLYLSQTAYGDCLHLADVAISMAGTATEQFVGLGKPAFITPGAGPQFTPTFAQLQARLLGPSVVLVEDPAQVGAAMAQVLNTPAQLEIIRQNGLRRMGKPGAAAAIAKVLIQQLL